jgi:hypothetical protein
MFKRISQISFPQSVLKTALQLLNSTLESGQLKVFIPVHRFQRVKSLEGKISFLPIRQDPVDMFLSFYYSPFKIKTVIRGLSMAFDTLEQTRWANAVVWGLVFAYGCFAFGQDWFRDRLRTSATEPFEGQRRMENASQDPKSRRLMKRFGLRESMQAKIKGAIGTSILRSTYISKELAKLIGNLCEKPRIQFFIMKNLAGLLQMRVIRKESSKLLIELLHTNVILEKGVRDKLTKLFIDLMRDPTIKRKARDLVVDQIHSPIIRHHIIAQLRYFLLTQKAYDLLVKSTLLPNLPHDVLAGKIALGTMFSGIITQRLGSF